MAARQNPWPSPGRTRDRHRAGLMSATGHNLVALDRGCRRVDSAAAGGVAGSRGRDAVGVAPVGDLVPESTGRGARSAAAGAAADRDGDRRPRRPGAAVCSTTSGSCAMLAAVKGARAGDAQVQLRACRSGSHTSDSGRRRKGDSIRTDLQGLEGGGIEAFRILMDGPEGQPLMGRVVLNRSRVVPPQHPVVKGRRPLG